jgi:glucose/arabinose dehydrogenase
MWTKGRGRFIERAALLATGAVALTGAASEAPDGVTLPQGFHATVVADGLGAIRHVAVRENGDVYVSTPLDPKTSGGIIALRLDKQHRAVQVERFGNVQGCTGIRFHQDRLYATSGSGVSRFTFKGDALLPDGEPEVIVAGTPETHPGFNRTNRPLAFDDSGHLFLGIDASGNLCTEPNTPAGQPPVGLKPCPDIGTRAGVWRFDANKIGQRFPADGEAWVTGIRDMTALDWSPADHALYGIVHGRDTTHRNWPDLVSEEDDDHVADEMHRMTKGTNVGWPYTYYDGVRKLRLIAPEYGGDGQKTADAGTYATPVLTFHSRRSAPVDLLFYTGTQFPKPYQKGAFVVLHGTANRSGYNVMFVPFDARGVAGQPAVFADGFAQFGQSTAPGGRAVYRPMGVAMAPDGSLYIADSQKGRIWRVAYGQGS